MRPPKVLVYLLTILILAAALAGSRLVQAAQGEQFFAQTGHWVRGPFLDFYNKSPDPLLLFGYPITEAFPHPYRPDVQVQYFQRARMELDANSPNGQQVKLATLGEWLYDSRTRGEIANFAVTSGACRAFSATGKSVCYAFLQFYDANQGTVYFGNPISDVEIQDGRPVQYFEYARMEWRPEEQPGHRVALTDIGRLDFDVSVGDRNRTNPLASGSYQLMEIRVYAFPDQPLIGDGERQAVFVIVKDQYGKPVPDATVEIKVTFPDGHIENLPSSPTNEDGFSRTEFTLHGLKPNETLKIFARASVLNGPTGEAETMFRIWW